MVDPIPMVDTIPIVAPIPIVDPMPHGSIPIVHRTIAFDAGL